MADLQIVPACKNVEAQYVEMRVPLYSYGCQRKVKKALSQLKGIYSVSVDYKLQKVTVWGICNKYDVLSTLRSKRKGARFWDCKEESLEIVYAPPEPSKPMISKKMLRSLSWKALMKVIKSY
ncbi:hypothetical protein GIB67_033208 [Kingdonia uniflora]|uniref:HMA domain-containing protein n=1 Tax=Kingdonia uniflora TaxID=39325 RepID=A0A7J7MP77_9MAGN|nr:hypothetical protein GIB67_033208 [Kingdonia uniflora]